EASMIRDADTPSGAHSTRSSTFTEDAQSLLGDRWRAPGRTRPGRRPIPSRAFTGDRIPMTQLAATSAVRAPDAGAAVLGRFHVKRDDRRRLGRTRASTRTPRSSTTEAATGLLETAPPATAPARGKFS